MIWRDDDISYLTDLKQFSLAHDLFKKHNVTHTIALIAKDIEKAPELIQYIKDNNIDVQLHCWEHVDYTEEIELLSGHLEKGITTIKNVFGNRPTILYPPWNKSNVEVEVTAATHDLEVSADKISLSAYIRARGGVSEKVINFHYWAHEEMMFLEQALIIYNEKRSKCI